MAKGGQWGEGLLLGALMHPHSLHMNVCGLTPGTRAPLPAQVSVMRTGSHELFRAATDVQACVVLLRSVRNGGACAEAGAEAPPSWLPAPEELAASLRGQRPSDEL